jgi:hypothetical protein
VAGAIALASLAGSVPPLVAVVFGETWSDSAPTILWSCVGIMISGGIGVSTGGYLLAAGLAGATILSAVAMAIAWIGVTAALLPVLGAEAVGVGWIVGAVAEATVLAGATRRSCGANVVGNAALPLGAGAAGCVAGGLVGLELGPGIPAALAGLAAGTGTTLALLGLASRSALVECVRLTRASWQRAFRSSRLEADTGI